MSVLSSMRKVSYVEFLNQTSSLAAEVREWARSQSPKDRELGVNKLYQLAEDAYNEAFGANNFYPSDVKAIDYRIQHFKIAMDKLHTFNAQLSLLRQSGNKQNKRGLKITNKRAKKWCCYSERALKLLSGVINKDKQRRKELEVKKEK